MDPARLNQLIKFLGAYGIVQVLAQDLGIKSGKEQVELVHTLPVQLALLYAAAYLVTEDQTLAIIAVVAYYVLKYIYSTTLSDV